MRDESPTVLLLEDNADDERLALRALRSCGLTLNVRVARDGQLGLSALGLDAPIEPDDPCRPDLVISDLKMPCLNGDEVLARAREDARLVRVPFVIFSSSEEPADLERCKALGANAYYVKPVGFDEYMTCARDIVRHWLAPNGEAVEPPCEVELSTGTA